MQADYDAIAENPDEVIAGLEAEIEALTATQSANTDSIAEIELML